MRALIAIVGLVTCLNVLRAEPKIGQHEALQIAASLDQVREARSRGEHPWFEVTGLDDTAVRITITRRLGESQSRIANIRVDRDSGEVSWEPVDQTPSQSMTFSALRREILNAVEESRLPTTVRECAVKLTRPYRQAHEVGDCPSIRGGAVDGSPFRVTVGCGKSKRTFTEYFVDPLSAEVQEVGSWSSSDSVELSRLRASVAEIRDGIRLEIAHAHEIAAAVIPVVLGEGSCGMVEYIPGLFPDPTSLLFVVIPSCEVGRAKATLKDLYVAVNLRTGVPSNAMSGITMDSPDISARRRLFLERAAVKLSRAKESIRSSCGVDFGGKSK